jgi:hypothetical protein
MPTSLPTSMQQSTHQTSIRHIDCSAVEAISTWLDGEYHCGDEYALLVAIRRQAPTDLTDAEIKALIHEASEHGHGAAAVLTQLLSPRKTAQAASPSAVRPHDHDARALRTHG